MAIDAANSSAMLPLFSIIVPTYDRPERLSRCLQALADIDYPRTRYEVVVVDDGGEHTLNTLIDSLAARTGVAARLVRQENAGPASARNHGARVATGHYLAFTDDDCAPRPGWLTGFARGFERSPGCLLGGRVVNALPENPFSTASQDLVAYLYEYYNGDPDDARFFASNNLATPVDAFRELGGFDEGFPLSAGEDRELCDRWRGTGRRLAYAPDAVVDHSHELTLRTFWRQHFTYGRGALHFREARLRRNVGGPQMEPLSFYANLLGYPLRQRRGAAAVRDVALMALTQLANSGGFFREKIIARGERLRIGAPPT